MRLWSLHPGYLDRQGLLACWREALLAQKVLAGGTRGYTNHPQLLRFRDQDDPACAVGLYLSRLADEAGARGYRFDRSRIGVPDGHVPPLEVTTGQLEYELAHLRAKLAVRSPQWPATWPAELAGSAVPVPHPLFRVVPGEVAPWEVRR